MSERETITCPNPKCKLVQFRSAKDLCRRCKESTAPPEPEPIPVSVLGVNPEPAMFPEGLSEEWARAVQLVLTSRRGSKSQRQMAAKMGVPRTYVSKVENGRAIPNLTSFERFARGFGIPLWLLVMEIELMRVMLTQAREAQER